MPTESVKLNEEQVRHLKDYIKSKGFHDPVVVMEILDHFACKVEEVMANNPELTFYNAMHKARMSFGFSGFQPIARSLEKHTRNKYRSIYWKTFFSIQYLPLALLVGYFSYRSWLWCAVDHYQLLYENLFSIAFVLTYIAVFAATFMIYLRPYKKVYHVKIGRSIGTLLPIYLIWNNTANHGHLAVHAVIVAVSVVYVLLHSISQYKVISVALSDYRSIERFIIE